MIVRNSNHIVKWDNNHIVNSSELYFWHLELKLITDRKESNLNMLYREIFFIKFIKDYLNL